MKKEDGLALLAGAALPLAFAPFYLSILAFLAPATLLYTWLYATPALAFRRGFIFGIGFFGVGISWVYISIHVFGGAPAVLAIFITAIFVSYLAFFPAMQGYCLNKYLPTTTPFKLLMAFPMTWVMFEMLRGWLFTGFPWLFLGYSQSNTWLQGFAPLFGVYGLSFITVFLSGMLVTLGRGKIFFNRLIGLFSFILLFVTGGWLASINWTTPYGQPQRATLIQGNIQQDLKWQPEQVTRTLRSYMASTQKHWSSDLIIWPEAAVTIPLNQARGFLSTLDKMAKQHHTALITGIPITQATAAYNGMVTMGCGQGVYYKRHLVPFGEYIPLQPVWRIAMQLFSIPMSTCQPGAKSQSPLLAKDIAIAPSICYEVAYPLEFLTFLPQAQLLLTITDDSWFGYSIAAQQHLQMAQLRAMETGRYLLFSSNTGITAVINAKGDIIRSIPPFQEAALTVTIQPMAGNTPWIIWKTCPLLGFALLIFVRGLRVAASAPSPIKELSSSKAC